MWVWPCELDGAPFAAPEEKKKTKPNDTTAEVEQLQAAMRGKMEDLKRQAKDEADKQREVIAAGRRAREEAVRMQKVEAKNARKAFQAQAVAEKSLRDVTSAKEQMEEDLRKQRLAKEEAERKAQAAEEREAVVSKQLNLQSNIGNSDDVRGNVKPQKTAKTNVGKTNESNSHQTHTCGASGSDWQRQREFEKQTAYANLAAMRATRDAG